MRLAIRTMIIVTVIFVMVEMIPHITWSLWFFDFSKVNELILKIVLWLAAYVYLQILFESKKDKNSA